ncbi:MAG: type II secretion system protein GspL [Chromatiales bacterium]|nr:type II secretion system protein GspL [Chromatiales bacterium]
MAEYLILHCHDASCNQLSWSIRGASSSETGSGNLQQAAQQAKGRRTLVLAPASEILITSVNIPTRNRQRLLQAIPFSLENELTEDIDDLHFAAGNMESDNITPVAVVARSRLDEWLEKLESAGIEPLGLYPDMLALPMESGAWCLYQSDHQLQIRTQTNLGYSVDGVNGGEFLKLALQQAGESAPQKLILYRLNGSGSELDLETLAPDCEIITQEIENPTDLSKLLADNLHEKQLLNLLQGEYHRVDKTTLQWKRWLPAAVLALIFFALSIGSSIQEYNQYDSQSKALHAQIRETFQQAFPDVKRIVDPRAQMEQRLKSLQRGQSGSFAQFASLFVPSASVIKNSPNTTLQNISFRDGQLNLQLTIKELQALETLKKTIESKRLTVEIRSANAADNQVTSHLRITGGS